METLLLIIISSAIVNNVVLSQFLGLCPFLGVSKKVDTALGMGVAVIFVITISAFITSLIYKFILVTLGLEYLQTIVFILVIAALGQFVEMFLKKSVPSLYEALGVYLPLITTNCAVLGVALNSVTLTVTIFWNPPFTVLVSPLVLRFPSLFWRVSGKKWNTMKSLPHGKACRSFS